MYSSTNKFLASYIPGSYFGEFQLILGLKSGYRYVGLAHRTNYLFSVRRKEFLKCLYCDYDALVYLTKLGL